MTSESFCVLPWLHLAVFPEGSAKLCCVANGRVENKGEPMSIEKEGLDGLWNSTYMKRVRKDMIEGRRVADCESCVVAEQSFGESRRTTSNTRWRGLLGSRMETLVADSRKNDFHVESMPVYYQLMPGNLCNLKCRMCFPTFSTLIERDAVHSRWNPPLFEIHSVPEHDSGSIQKTRKPPSLGGRLPSSPWYRDDEWVRDVLLQNSAELRGLYFTGGEPLIEPQVANIVDTLIERGVAGDVELELNTNCTVVREEMIEKLLRFKKVTISLSLDAYGAFHEYIRYPARWSTLEKNVRRLAEVAGESLVLSASPVLQVYNALNVVDVLRFLDEFSIDYRLTIASMPWFLSVQVLPAGIRRIAAKRLREYGGRIGGGKQEHLDSLAGYLETLVERPNPESLRAFMLFTNDLDPGRRQSFRQVHTELRDLLDASGFVWTDERLHSVSGSVPPTPQPPADIVIGLEQLRAQRDRVSEQARAAGLDTIGRLDTGLRESERATSLEVIEALDARVRRAESELHDIRASWSWRLTGPLRYIREKVSRPSRS